MKRANIIGALIILLFSVLFTVEAKKMPLFEGASPGPGFIPFWIGGLVMILSFGLLLQSLRMDPQKGKVPFMEKKHGLKDIVYITLSLFAYCGLILLVGYPISTFLFLLFLMKAVGKYSYKFSLGISIMSTAALQGIFNYWLEMALPKGILIPL